MGYKYQDSNNGKRTSCQVIGDGYNKDVLEKPLGPIRHEANDAQK
jgi:hypothetical protein